MQEENSNNRVFTEAMKKRLLDLIVKHHGNERGNVAKFAKNIGISSGNVADWLNHDKNALPGARALARICEHYPNEIYFLLTGEKLLDLKKQDKLENEDRLAIRETQMTLLQMQLRISKQLRIDPNNEKLIKEITALEYVSSLFDTQ